MEIPVLKLPKDLAADPRHDAVLNLLTAHAGSLWESGRNDVATVPMTDALAAVLRSALAAGLACQGLESATDKLALATAANGYGEFHRYLPARVGLLIALDEPLGFGFNDRKVATVRTALGGKW